LISYNTGRKLGDSACPTQLEDLPVKGFDVEAQIPHKFHGRFDVFL